MAAYPIFQPYGTVQNSFNQVMSRDPIQYNVPISQMRPPEDQGTFNNGLGTTMEDRTKKRAEIMASGQLARQQAGYGFNRAQWNQTTSLLPQLNVGANQANSIYNSAYQQGIISTPGPNQNSQYIQGSTGYLNAQNNRDQNQAQAQSNFLLSGVDPDEVQRAYQKFLKSNVG